MPDGGIIEVEFPEGEEGVCEMVEAPVGLPPEVAGIMTQQLTQTGVIAQNNFVTTQKVVDYDYLENKRMVTLDEAVGIREVASKVTPGGPSPAAG